MRDDEMDENQLGHAVDAWLTTLRGKGLSDRRIGELARLLGQAMSEGGPTTSEQACVLRRFVAWRRAHSSE